jgi:prolyl-tRNA synthetase
MTLLHWMKLTCQLFRLADRKEVPMILSPTHEEEITTLVAGTLKSYKELPIRLYQISALTVRPQLSYQPSLTCRTSTEVQR